MFTEVLKIVPRIDRAALAVMESTLTKRFVRVAGRFGKGLEKVMKGNLLFLSLGFVSQLLNPLEKVHDRIKELLGEGFDISELADRFNTSPGTVKRLQALGQSLGLSPERLNEMMGKFADAIEKARDELSNPFVEPSKATTAVSEFVDEKDLGKAFFQFIRSLQSQGKAQGVLEVDKRTGLPAPAEDRARLQREGLLDRLTGSDIREQIEKEIFGEIQRGAARRFIESDFMRDLARIGLRGGDIEAPGRINWEGKEGAPTRFGTSTPLDDAIENLIRKAEMQRVTRTKNELNTFVTDSQLISDSVVKGVEAADKREADALTLQLSQAERLQQASENLAEMTKLLTTISNKVLEGVGYLSTFIPDLLKKLDSLKETLLKLTDSRLLRAILK